MSGPLTACNAGQALAVVLVDEFARCGVRHAFVAPGSRSTPLAMALAEQTAIAVHVILDERSAAFCALGVGKASGAPALVVCTSGTATANLFPALVEADQSRTPMLVLTADRPPELRNTGANQTIDQIKLYGGSVRWFAEVGVPEARREVVGYWRSTACRAWAEATGSPAGPVHLNLAFRDPLVPVADRLGFTDTLEGRPGGQPWTRTSRGPRGLAAGDLARLSGEIAACERGLVVAGASPGDTGPARELAAAAGWPLIADPLSGLRQDGAISTAEALLRHPGFASAMVPDLVVRVGGLGTGKALPALLQPGVRQVLIDPDGAWADPERAVAWLIDADPGLAAAQLAADLRERAGAGSGWLGAWRQADRLARQAIDDVLDGQELLSEPGTARTLAALCPDGTTLVAGSSMPVRDLEWFMAPRARLRVLANRGASGIDGFASTVLGAALAGPHPTVALAGDLSLLHDQNGLLLARSEAVDAVFVVINNDGGGIFSFLPQAEHPSHFERLFGTPQGVSFAALAALYGCPHHRAARAEDLAGALKASLDAGGVHLIEVQTERSANVAAHRDLWQAVAGALDTLPPP